MMPCLSCSTVKGETMKQFIIDGLGYAVFIMAGVVLLAAWFDVLFL